MEILRTDSTNLDFLMLVKLLDAELAERDGEDHEFYNSYNNVDTIKNAIVCKEEGIPIGCGGIKELEPGSMEVKRMYVLPEYRGKGIASIILRELEVWAKELGYQRCILETGKRQPEAIRLYEKNDYSRIVNYGPYQGIENSVCFEKRLNK